MTVDEKDGGGKKRRKFSLFLYFPFSPSFLFPTDPCMNMNHDTPPNTRNADQFSRACLALAIYIPHQPDLAPGVPSEHGKTFFETLFAFLSARPP